MAVQFLTYNDENMQPGKFYLIEANLDQASNIRDISTITNPLNEATQDIIDIKAKNELQDIKINEMKGGIDKYVDTILDNQARINNLEDTEINKIIMFLDKISIRNNFENSKLIEISHHRKSITSVKVMEQMLKTDTETLFKDITHSVSISEHNSITDGVETKKVIIESNDPITGYAIIL